MSLPKKPWETTAPRTAAAASSAASRPIATASSNTGVPQSSTISTAATTASLNPHDTSAAMMGQGGASSSMYGAGGAYGSRYGMGASPYGGGYGSAYGGGYGSSMYGGSMYGGGGYGGGYGGGMYGGGMYGGGGGGPMMMDPNGNMGWLVSFNQTVSAIGQITQVLGMNAESLNFCFGSFVHFMERMAFLTTNAVAMLSPKPVFPPGHPRYGEPPESDEEIKSRLRRVRVVKFLVSLVAIYAASRVVQYVRNLWRRPKPALTYDKVFGSIASTTQSTTATSAAPALKA